MAAGVLLVLAVATSPVRVMDEGCPSGAQVELALGSMLVWGGRPAKEDALYGRAAFRSALGDTSGARDDLHRYLDRLPNGSHVDWARR